MEKPEGVDKFQILISISEICPPQGTGMGVSQIYIIISILQICDT